MLTKAEPVASDAPDIEVREEGGATHGILSGNWTTMHAAAIDRALRAVAGKAANGSLVFDLSGIRRMDTAGALLLRQFEDGEGGRNGKVEFTGATQSMTTLLDAVGKSADRHPPEEKVRRFGPVQIVEGIGRGAFQMAADFGAGMSILGATIQGAQMKLGRGHGINPAAIVNQIHRMGVGAIPVVLLMSSIVGAIVAQQGAFQLRYFGAEIFVVDLVGILVWREMGVLLTAIMVAGRSGSAITAEIGSMKMREEVDALKVIGLNPVGVLVFPRLVALVIALPCLTIFANFAAIGGAMAVSWAYSGIPPQAFLDRMRDSIDMSTVFAGLIKAPFMALIIGIIASVEGMKVGGSAESLGKQVTSSVVRSIFMVVIVDGLFAIFFAAINF